MDEPPRIRRGLPRHPGDHSETVASPPGNTATTAEPSVSRSPSPVIRRGLGAPPAPAPVDASRDTRSNVAANTSPGVAAPNPVARASVGTAARPAPTRSTAKPAMLGVLLAWVVPTLLAGFAMVILAAAAVLLVRIGIQLPPVRDFLTRFPGEYELPAGSEPGFPLWVQWQHFFTTFLMVLIIRSGLRVRTEKRPTAFWTPRWSKDGQGKVSLTIWFHQALDVLWVANGVIFVVLLFVTGHWVRIVPTSWEVLPNALSAAIQYASLDWPTHDGWVNYNSLQQLMYFATVFIAAPLAIATGLRMSSLWPRKAARLNRLYPVEWARAVHFPVMLYFVAFIIVHVTLVLATGALRNLNHIYGGTDTVNWVGFMLFLGSIALIAIAWVLARPVILAPIARLSGRVSGR